MDLTFYGRAIRHNSVLIKMIALLGSGEYLPGMEAVDRFLLDHIQGEPLVVCLPTAAGNEGEDRISYWNQLSLNHFKRLQANVLALPVIDKFSANDPVFVKSVSKANFIYFSGGKPDYLYETLEQSLLWDAVLDVLARGGILAGCSAGAMIMGEKFYSPRGWRSGFNFLPGITVFPHFDVIPEHRVTAISSNIDNGLKLIGIDSETALIFGRNKYHVMGRGGVSIFNGSSEKRFVSGPIPPTVFTKL